MTCIELMYCIAFNSVNDIILMHVWY